MAAGVVLQLLGMRGSSVQAAYPSSSLQSLVTSTSRDLTGAIISTWMGLLGYK